MPTPVPGTPAAVEKYTQDQVKVKTSIKNQHKVYECVFMLILVTKSYKFFKVS